MEWKLAFQIVNILGLAVILAAILRIRKRGDTPILVLVLSLLMGCAVLGFITDSWFHDNVNTSTSMMVILLILALAANNFTAYEGKRPPGDDSDDAFR